MMLPPSAATLALADEHNPLPYAFPVIVRQPRPALETRGLFCRGLLHRRADWQEVIPLASCMC